MSKHKTTDNLELTGAFTVSFADIRTVAESDYLGIVSGNNVPDKVAKAGFTITPSPNVVNMSADESILTDGKVDLAKLQPIVFDAAGMCYRAIGEVVGGAWNAGKKFID